MIKIQKNSNASTALKEIFRSNRRSSMAIISSGVMKCVPGKVTLFTTDLDQSVRVIFDCPDCEVSDTRIISGSAMEFIGKQIGKGDLTVRLLDRDSAGIAIEIENENGISKFTAEEKFSDYNDYPSQMCFAGLEFENWKASREDLEFVKVAISSDETRPHINGALFDGKNIVSTDGHRLHKVETENNPIGVLRFKALDLFLKMKRWISCEVATDKGLCFFKMSDHASEITLVSNLINADFPPYDQVIPKTGKRASFESGVVLVAKQISEIAKQIGNKGRGAAIEISPNGMYHSNPTENIEIQAKCEFFGKDVSIGFNSGYLAEAMTGLKTANLLLNKTPNPGLMVAGNRIAVLMPMRI